MDAIGESVHVYDAKLDAGSALQEFFENDTLVVATRFFRDQSLFDELATEVIPQLLKTGLARRKVLRIWSAGCSDGRESYSLAAAAHQVLDQLGHKKIELKVRGSDLSRPQLEKARQGLYKVDPKYAGVLESYGEYFTQIEPAQWQATPGLRDMVEFGVEDITKVKPQGQFDILVCSLVVLYYEQNYQKEIIKGLLKTMREDGFFYAAPVSTKWMKSQGYVPVTKGGRFYHKNQVAS